MQAASSRTTIAAIATGSGGGVGIVRVSGPLAEEIGRMLCSPWPAELKSHQLYLGCCRDPGGEVLDQVLFCLMRGPRSFTGEDVLEIHGHGGEQNLQSLLHAVMEAGAEMAAPGEFTRRAFGAGKLDLTQAEALASVIGAQTQVALRQAQRQLNGELGRLLSGLRRRAVQLLASIEAALDFQEGDSEDPLQLRNELNELHEEIAQLAGSFQHGGRALAQGLRIALVGATNAGKSSLINALCGGERILVHSQPGTTRDFIEVRTAIGDIEVTLVDTAGLREGGTELEEQGWRLGQQQHAQADFLWLVVDGARGLDVLTARYLEQLHATVPLLVVWNKVDQQACLGAPPGREVVSCSALCGWGLDELKRRTLARVMPERDSGELMVMSARQAALLLEAAEHLKQAGEAAASMGALDIVASDLREAAACLGAVSGEHVTPAVLDSIFEQFCIGK